MIALLHIVRVIVGFFCVLCIFGSVAGLGLWLLKDKNLFSFPIVIIVQAILSGALFVWIGCVISRLYLKMHGATHSTLPENPAAAASKVLAAGRPETGAPPGSVGRALGLKPGLALSLLALLIGIVLMDVAQHGFGLSACGFGFGARHQALKDELVASVFSEALPAKLDIEDFRCGGFQDFYVDFKLRLPNPQGQALGAALDRAFESGSSNPHSTGGREITRVTQPDRTVTKFTLPGVRGLDVREIELHLPTDPAQPATLVFRGYSM